MTAKAESAGAPSNFESTLSRGVALPGLGGDLALGALTTALGDGALLGVLGAARAGDLGTAALGDKGARLRGVPRGLALGSASLALLGVRPPGGLAGPQALYAEAWGAPSCRRPCPWRGRSCTLRKCREMSRDTSCQELGLGARTST